MNGVCRSSPSQFCIFYFFSLVAMTRAKRHLVRVFFFCSSIYSFDAHRNIFSVLLEIPQPYAMGVNILRNG